MTNAYIVVYIRTCGCTPKLINLLVKIKAKRARSSDNKGLYEDWLTPAAIVLLIRKNKTVLRVKHTAIRMATFFKFHHRYYTIYHSTQLLPLLAQTQLGYSIAIHTYY